MIDAQEPPVRGVDLLGLLLENLSVNGWQDLMWHSFSLGRRSILARAIGSTPEERLEIAEMAARYTIDYMIDEDRRKVAKYNLLCTVRFNSLS